MNINPEKLLELFIPLKEEFGASRVNTGSEYVTIYLPMNRRVLLEEDDRMIAMLGPHSLSYSYDISDIISALKESYKKGLDEYRDIPCLKDLIK